MIPGLAIMIAAYTVARLLQAMSTKNGTLHTVAGGAGIIGVFIGFAQVITAANDATSILNGLRF